MVRAVWNGAVLAESDDVVVVDGYTYFPRGDVDPGVLVESAHTSVCGWKGRASYYNVVVDGGENRDAAWYYPDPKPAARTVEGRIGFWRGVKIVPDGDQTGAARPRLFDRLRRRAPAVPDAPSAVVELDDASFEAATEGAWTIVDFWAPWCGPCRAFHPVFESAARDTPDIRFAQCDVDASPRTAAALQILSIPTVVLFDPDGNEVDRIAGAPTASDFAGLLARARSTSGSAA